MQVCPIIFCIVSRLIINLLWCKLNYYGVKYCERVLKCIVGLMYFAYYSISFLKDKFVASFLQKMIRKTDGENL